MTNAWLLALSLLFEPSLAWRCGETLAPLPHERIEPIRLEKTCAGVTVVESQGGLPSPGARRTLQSVCSLAFARFPSFLRMHKLRVPEKVALEADVSLLDVGSGPRQLNDPKRFADCGIPTHPDGRPYLLYGYYARITRHILVRNDLLVRKQPHRVTMRSFAHELFHAMTSQNGIDLQLRRPQEDHEERLAREFTAFLGLGE
jgi:hypothetical protein